MVINSDSSQKGVYPGQKYSLGRGMGKLLEVYLDMGGGYMGVYICKELLSYAFNTNAL